MAFPKRVSLVWVDKVRNTRFSVVLCIGVLGYILISLLCISFRILSKEIVC